MSGRQEIVPYSYENSKRTTYREQIRSLYFTVFSNPQYRFEHLMSDFLNPKNFVEMLIELNCQQVVGFMLAEPVPHDKSTAYISFTAIHPNFQHAGLVGILAQRIEYRLKQNKFLYITIDALVINGYAASIEKHYGNRIIHQQDVFRSDWGHQRFFKIQL